MKNLKVTASLTSLLAVTLIVLKLTEVLDWSWIWILFPIWIDIAIISVIVTVILIGLIVKRLKD